jgi:peptidase E
MTDYLGPITAGAKAVFIPAGDDKPGCDARLTAGLRQWAALQILVTVFDLRHKTEDQTRAVLKDADIICIGGDVSTLAASMRRINFKELLMDRLIAGATYIGSDIGSYVCTLNQHHAAGTITQEEPKDMSYQGAELIDFYLLAQLEKPAEPGSLQRSFLQEMEDCGMNSHAADGTFPPLAMWHKVSLAESQVLVVDKDEIRLH